MTTSKILYTGSLRTQATHLASQNTIVTDAPIDNHGKGEAFSPTDLMATSLGSCMVTMMGIKANQSGWNIDGITVDITKIMGTEPRRIVQIDVIVTFPAGDYDDKTKKILEHTALTCPVGQSLHPDLNQNIVFVWS
ncbi:MAG: OsmC family protein [Bacteroidetes bacterium]|nr:OsmC family protein [Bacteroidota bacterium]